MPWRRGPVDSPDPRLQFVRRQLTPEEVESFGNLIWVCRFRSFDAIFWALTCFIAGVAMSLTARYQMDQGISWILIVCGAGGPLMTWLSFQLTWEFFNARIDFFANGVRLFLWRAKPVFVVNSDLSYFKIVVESEGSRGSIYELGTRRGACKFRDFGRSFDAARKDLEARIGDAKAHALKTL